MQVIVRIVLIFSLISNVPVSILLADPPPTTSPGTALSGPLFPVDDFGAGACLGNLFRGPRIKDSVNWSGLGNNITGNTIGLNQLRTIGGSGSNYYHDLLTGGGSGDSNRCTGSKS